MNDDAQLSPMQIWLYVAGGTAATLPPKRKRASTEPLSWPCNDFGAIYTDTTDERVARMQCRMQLPRN